MDVVSQPVTAIYAPLRYCCYADQLMEAATNGTCQVRAVSEPEQLITMILDEPASPLHLIAHRFAINQEAQHIGGFDGFMRRYIAARQSKPQLPVGFLSIETKAQTQSQWRTYAGWIDAYYHEPFDVCTFRPLYEQLALRIALVRQQSASTISPITQYSR